MTKFFDCLKFCLKLWFSTKKLQNFRARAPKFCASVILTCENDLCYKVARIRDVCDLWLRVQKRGEFSTVTFDNYVIAV